MSKEKPIMEFNQKEKWVEILGFRITDEYSLEEYLEFINNLQQENEKLKGQWEQFKEWLYEQEKKSWDEVSRAFGYIIDKIEELEKGSSK